MSKRQKKSFPKNIKKQQALTTKGVYVGIIDVNSSGNGYFMCTSLENDIFISESNLNTAQNKDEVEVEVFIHKSKKGKLLGRVIKILKRHKLIFTGTVFSIVHQRVSVKLSDKNVSKEVLVDTDEHPYLRVGDKVAIAVQKWSNGDNPNKGKIIDLLGVHGEHNAEIKSILIENGLPYTFPKDVERFVETLNTELSEKEIKKRKDLRGILTITIDPKDAKDFDDALSLEVLPNGNFQVGVHIADVSHYVQPGTILDAEAYERATSVYLVDRVVPMLPEVLSNNVCSLRPHEDKYTFSALFEITPNAKVIKKWFGKTVICSDERFTYEEAQHIIETHKKNIPSDVSLNGKSYDIGLDILTVITNLNHLAKKIRQNRLESGAFSFDKQEMKLLLDKENEPVEVYLKAPKEANYLVEEFMILANKSVAEFLGKEKKKISVYRIHDKANIEKLQLLGDIVSKLGYKLELKKENQISKSLNTLLSEVKGQKEQNLVESLAIRSMSKAEYSIHNIGHYGLALEYYTHFTSPIRRYPDVIVHRILEDCLKDKSSDKQKQSKSYEECCKHASQMETVAVNAERDSLKYMQIRFLELHPKESYEGIISGVTDRGIYVEISENRCEGMIRLKDIKGDYYIFNAEDYSITGQKSKKSYRLGDKVSISVKSLDIEKRHINLELKQ